MYRVTFVQRTQKHQTGCSQVVLVFRTLKVEIELNIVSMCIQSQISPNVNVQ